MLSDRTGNSSGAGNAKGTPIKVKTAYVPCNVTQFCVFGVNGWGSRPFHFCAHYACGERSIFTFPDDFNEPLPESIITQKVSKNEI